jgi:nucleoside-diphosphate-sugar epimerase
MAKVLITGATGFIGGRLAERLAAEGRKVRCLARRGADVRRLERIGVELVEGDVTAPATLCAAVADVDVVFHLAGMIKALRGSDYFRVNQAGVENIMAACAKRTTPPTVVHLSSLAAAGPALGGRPRVESDPPAPVSKYGRSKLAGEMAAVARAAELPITIVRPPIVLGGGDRIGLVLYRMIARPGWHLVPGLRRSKFSIVHVDDLIDGLIRAAERGSRLRPAPDLEARGIYYLAGDSDLTYGDLGRAIGTAIGRRRVLVVHVPSPLVWPMMTFVSAMARVRRKPVLAGVDKTREALAGDWTCCAERARKELGFRTAAPLADRLAETAEWYRREGWM